jgi:hypothetical protein
MRSRHRIDGRKPSACVPVALMIKPFALLLRDLNRCPIGCLRDWL